MALQNHLKLLFIFLSAMIFIQSTAFAKLHKAPFKWLDDEDYAPFIYKEQNGKPQGFYKDLMVEIFNRMNIPLELELYPWKRTQKFLEEGYGDGMITTLTKKRKALFIATEPLFVNCERVFARKDNPKIKKILAIKSIKDLKPFKVVETIGSGWSEEHLNGLNIIWVPTHTTALKLLAKGRVDIYILGKYPGLADIFNRIKEKLDYSDGLKKIVMGEHSLAKIEFSLLIRKTSPYVNIIPKFNKTLNQLKKDGTYKKIFRKFFPVFTESSIIHK